MSETNSTTESEAPTSIKSFPSVEDVKSSRITIDTEGAETHEMGLITQSPPSMTTKEWLECASGHDSFRVRYHVDIEDSPDSAKPGFRNGLKWWTPSRKTRIAWVNCWMGDWPEGVNLDLVVLFYSKPPRMMYHFKAGAPDQTDLTTTKIKEVPIEESYIAMRSSSLSTCYSAIIGELQAIKTRSLTPPADINLYWMTDTISLWYKSLIKNTVAAALHDMEWREHKETAKKKLQEIGSQSQKEKGKKKCDTSSLD